MLKFFKVIVVLQNCYSCDCKHFTFHSAYIHAISFHVVYTISADDLVMQEPWHH